MATYSDAYAAAYDALMADIFYAPTREALIELVPQILQFTGGRETLDFGEGWHQRWNDVTHGAPVPDDLWPPPQRGLGYRG